MATRIDESWTNWSTPENLGNKINSEREESFFSISSSDSKIYFAAESDSTGNLDIFTLELPETPVADPTPVLATNTDKTSNTEVPNQSNNLLETTLLNIAFSSIYFESNKSEIRPDVNSDLEQLHKLLKENPTVQIEITGHTDNIGSHNYNYQLSFKRAAHIAKFLASNGIDKDRIIIKNMAAKSPAADNLTKEGRSLNRRVDLKIVTT